MVKLKKIFYKNPELQFMGSYLTVLCFPVFLISIGMLFAFYSVERVNYNSNVAKMEHSVQLIDNSLSALNSMSVQCSNAASIKRAASISKVQRNNILEFKAGLDDFTSLLLYQMQSIGFVDKYYLYFNKSNYFFYENSLYAGERFKPYLQSWGIEVAEWKTTVACDEVKVPQYVVCSGKLHYIIPINVINGYNSSMLVLMFDTDELLSYFDYIQESFTGVLYVTDSEKNILFCNDSEYDAESAQQAGFPAIQEKYESRKLMKCISNKKWEFYFWIENSLVGKDTISFWGLAVLFEIMIVLVCLLISSKQAKRIGKPLNEIFNMVAPDGNKYSLERKSTEILGEIVADIVSNNQEMLEEIRQSNPQLRKAFLHDLLTLDVSGTMELQHLVKNAGINMNADVFWVVSVRLFSNNDVYDTDIQTLEDVRIIIRSMQKYIEENLGENVWFYQRNYLSLLILIDGQNQDLIMEIVENTKNWLLNVFSTESIWGISTECNNIINIWKYVEESEIARKYCYSGNQIMMYTTDISDERECYFPQTAEDKLVNYMNACDTKAIGDVFSVLRHENLNNRRLTRKGIIELNCRISDMLIRSLGEQESIPYIMKLNNIIVENTEVNGELYFSMFEKILGEICVGLKRIKGIKCNELIDRIQDYIEKNYANPNLGLGNVSVAFGVSEGYISSLFKRQTQIGFNEYVEKIRMEKAVELLKKDDGQRKSVEMIAEMVGYNSVQVFRRAFKRVYGVSPRSYR